MCQVCVTSRPSAPPPHLGICKQHHAHCITVYCTLCYTMLHHVTLCYTVYLIVRVDLGNVSRCFHPCTLHCSILHHVTPCYTACYTMLHCVTLYVTLLHHVTLCYTMLHCVTHVTLYVTLCYTVSDYRDGLGKEIVSRFSTTLNSNATWYTDANGREIQKRV